MPVETRAQIKAREEAAKGPAGRAGARAASSRAKTLSSTSDVEVPPSPAAKKAVAAKKASAAAAKKSTAGKGSKKTVGRKKKTPFDTLAEDLGATLPPPAIPVPELDSIIVKPVDPSKYDSYSESGQQTEIPLEIPRTTIQVETRKDTPDIPTASKRETINATKNIGSRESGTTNTQDSIPDAQATKVDPDVTCSEDEEDGGIDLTPEVISKTWVDPYSDLSPAERAETISRYVCYRTGYSHTPEDWETYKGSIMDKFKAQELKLGKEESSLKIVWIEDEARFGGNNIPEVRKAFNTWCLERNPYAPNPETDPFNEGPYQDFTANICLAADSTSITSVLASIANSSSIPPTIIVVDRHFSFVAHAQEVAEAGDEVEGAVWNAPGDPREADADIVERGDKVIWKGYKGFFRAGIDEWMNVESEAQPERDLPSFWMQYFAKYAEGRVGGWELTRCGVLE